MFKTYSAYIAGIKFLFIPGQRNVHLGWSNGASKLSASEWFTQKSTMMPSDSGLVFSKQADVDHYINTFTSDSRVVTIPPLLVAIDALPITLQARGLYYEVSGKFSGDQRFYRQYATEISNLLYRQRQQTTTETISAGEHVSLRAVPNYQAYQVFENGKWSQQALRQQLRHEGLDFISSDQYEWLKSGGQHTLFVSGNHLPVLQGKRLVNRFGLHFAVPANLYEATTDSLIDKGGQCLTGGRYLIEQVLPASPFYESGIATAAMGNEDGLRTYRPTIPIVLD